MIKAKGLITKNETFLVIDSNKIAPYLTLFR